MSGSTPYTLAISRAYPPPGMKTPAGTGIRIFVLFLPGCIHIFLQ